MKPPVRSRQSAFDSSTTCFIFRWTTAGISASRSKGSIGWNWLAKATPEQRDNWSIEPGGFAVYWEDLDDGIEIMHLLNMQPLS